MLGAQVVMIGRDEKKLRAEIDEIKRDIASEPHGIPKKVPVYIIADLLLEKECKRVVEKTVNDHKQIDILVNSAGAIQQKSILEGDISIYDELYALNVRVPIMLAKAAIEPLKKSNGNIVNLSSTSGKNPHKGLAYYGITKACLDHFTKIAASVYVDSNVRVNSINLGAIDSPVQNKVRSKTGLTPLGSVCDAAYAVAYVASELSTFLTGNNLVVDGGAIVTAAYNNL